MHGSQRRCVFHGEPERRTVAAFHSRLAATHVRVFALRRADFDANETQFWNWTALFIHGTIAEYGEPQEMMARRGQYYHIVSKMQVSESLNLTHKHATMPSSLQGEYRAGGRVSTRPAG